MASDAIALRSGEICFFYSLVDAIDDPLLSKRYRAMLTETEKAKTDSFVFERDRHVCLITRAMIRYVLSVCTGTLPESFQFTTNRYGKPDLTPGCAPMPIRFNLSHSSGMTACAVTLDSDIGVDVEHRRDDIDLSLADQYFAPFESDYVRTRPAGSRIEAFFDIWTLKEAYIKARGMGLSIALDRFGFDIGRGIRIYMDDSLGDKPDHWTFFSFSPEANYHAALAVQTPAQRISTVTIYRCIPFVSIDKTYDLPAPVSFPLFL